MYKFGLQAIARSRLILLGVMFGFAFLTNVATAALSENLLGLSVTYVEDGYDFKPWPMKTIKDVKIHTTEPITINRAWVAPDWGAWIVGGKTSRFRLKADEVVTRPSALLRLGTPGGKTTRKIMEVQFERLKLLLGSTVIVLPKGEMEFGEDGALRLLRINMPEERMQLDMQVLAPGPTTPGALSLLLSTSGAWKWGALPVLRFEKLVAQGVLTDNQIAFSKIGASGLGGSVDGSLTITVSDRFVMEADLALQKLGATELLKEFFEHHTVRGMLSGRVKVRAEGENLTDMGAMVSSTGSFNIVNGSIDRMSLIEGLRKVTPGVVGGGITSFETMEGTFSGATGKPSTVSIRRLDGGALQGSGNLTVSPEGQLRGTMHAGMRLPSGDMKSNNLQLSGTVKAPELRSP